jgi:quercetin dioxygenase-like cupin family protein
VIRALALVLAACSGAAPPPAATVEPAPVAPAPIAPIDAAPPSEDEKLAAIQKAMNELDEAAQGCWAAVAVERFDIEGEIAALIDIHSGGATIAIARDTTRSPKLVACLTAVLAKYPWAPPLHGQAIQLPFKFRAPPDGQNVIDRALVPWHGQGKLAVAVLLDEHNSANAGASLLELAIAAGGSTGRRIATRAELWFFLGAGTVDGKPVAAHDMMFVPAGAARDVGALAGADLHAAIAIVPGGPEGAARAGALPTPELGAGMRAGAPVLLPAARATTYCIGHGRAPVLPCRNGKAATIYAEPATVKASVAAGTVIDFAAGMTVAEHVHAGTTEVLYILEGTGTMTVEGVALPITATSVVQIPPGKRHAVTATTRVRAFQVYTPAGPEQRFTTMARP